VAAGAGLKRVLLISSDVIGPAMAGPGIRDYHLALELARRFDVTVMAPAGSVPAADHPRLIEAEPDRYRQIKEIRQAFDVVIAERLEVRAMLHLARTRTRTIYDLYVPIMTEQLNAHGAAPAGRDARRRYQLACLLQAIAALTGDSLVCASERQRDFWLGVLAGGGRVDLELHRRDPTLRSLIDTVPFGIEARPPEHERRVVKGVVPGISATDRVLLWGGGIWDWLDPLTPIRAVARLGETRRDVKLFFLGSTSPSPGSRETTMRRHAVALSRELGVLNRSVFFNEDWVGYEDRQSFLLEADLGVSAHTDSVEARFAFRTRLLDCLWAGLPIVCTRGDVLGDLVAERVLGRTVAPGDVDGWARAIAELLDDRRGYAHTQANIRTAREAFFWPAVVSRLADMVERSFTRGRVTPAVRALTLRYFSLRAEAALARSARGHR